jgi:hypothetical protein
MYGGHDRNGESGGSGRGIPGFYPRPRRGTLRREVTSYLPPMLNRDSAYFSSSPRRV